MLAGGVVLAGGRSARMGRAKAGLDWDGSTLLARTVAVLAEAVGGPVVVVGAADQALPPVPDGVLVRSDPVAGRGPLQGLAVGLAALGGTAGVAFVAATDLPFLRPEFARRVVALLGDAEIALPVARGHRQPLAAAYRTGLADRVADLVAAGRLRPADLFAASVVRAVTEAELLADPALAAADPALDSLVNVNTPQEYAAAVARHSPG